MGFFDSSSSSSAIDQRADQSNNEGMAQGSGNSNSDQIKENEGVVVKQSSGVDVTIQAVDFGAIQAGGAVATEALRSSGATFEDLADTLKDGLDRALDSVDQANENTQEITDQAFSYSANSTAEALGAVAKATRSDGRELLEKLAPVFKWGAVAIIGTIALRSFRK